MDQPNQAQAIGTIMTPLVDRLGGKVTITKGEFVALGLVKTTLFFEEQPNGDVVIELAKGERAIEETRKRMQAAQAAYGDLVVPS